MFLFWAIPLALLIVLTVWLLRYALWGRVKVGERQPGRTLVDEDEPE